MGSYLMNSIMSQGKGVFGILFFSSFLMVLSSEDWFLIWVGLEINMISFISLIYSRSMLSVESSLKYFFVQSLGSGVLMAMFYVEFMYFDIMCMLMLSYKMGSGPFFFWFPSVCSGISWGSCLMLMSAQKIMPMILISMMMSFVLWFISFFSMFIGAIGSLNQVNLKRLMAYSSVHHIGWMLMSMYVMSMGWFFYLLIYFFMLLGVVVSFSWSEISLFSMMKGVSVKWSFVLSMLNMGGMPPFIGFFLKWWVFYYFCSFDSIMIMVMIVMSLFMFYAYSRIVYSILLGGLVSGSWGQMWMMKMESLNMDIFYFLGLNFSSLMLLMLI